MALTSRQRNNVIILVSAVMIIALSIMNRITNHVPSDAHPLFDRTTQLEQLQLGQLWLARQKNEWVCDDKVLNCSTWAKAWEKIKISPLDGTPDIHEVAEELVIKIRHRTTSQVWLFFPNDGLLKTENNNWYQIPASLKDKLIPITNAKPK
ncbi:hypothetical protein JQC92_14170 [Shewanella sp. 202IG2-18]|uniref:hypothetical protein n=1 Tax=Parashewanella hymeniacidonis TaxID=2807618 RepID=UPI00195F2C1B|nr:hypothetical protein [Parashewanella hymeniacidonis]MBM7073158.1 hypothetical protein [Parashewanella hymeniacidonis]